MRACCSVVCSPWMYVCVKAASRVRGTVRACESVTDIVRWLKDVFSDVQICAAL